MLVQNLNEANASRILTLQVLCKLDYQCQIVLELNSHSFPLERGRMFTQQIGKGDN